MEKIGDAENLLWQLVRQKCSDLSHNLHHPRKAKRERDGEDTENTFDQPQSDIPRPMMTSIPTKKPPQKVVIVAEEEANSTGKRDILNKKAAARLVSQSMQSHQLQRKETSVIV